VSDSGFAIAVLLLAAKYEHSMLSLVCIDLQNRGIPSKGEGGAEYMLCPIRDWGVVGVVGVVGVLGVLGVAGVVGVSGVLGVAGVVGNVTAAAAG